MRLKYHRQPPVIAFTIVELLVATAVLVLLVTLTAQMVGSTAAITASSSKRVDTAGMGRAMLDRFGNDFSAAMLGNGSTALYYQGDTANPNSAFVFVSKVRPRDSFGEPGVPSGDAKPRLQNDDVRGAVCAYKVRAQKVSKNSPLTYVVNRGDGAFTYSVLNTLAPYRADNRIWSLFGINGRKIPADMTIAYDNPDLEPKDGNYFTWTGIGNGVIRLHISFVLSSGKIVQTPPEYQGFNTSKAGQPLLANGGTGGFVIPVAFSSEDSASPDHAYVKGLIVGLVVLDEATLRLAYTRDPNFQQTFANQLERPIDSTTTPDQTPLSVWQANLVKKAAMIFAPVRENVQFYQRFYPVNL